MPASNITLYAKWTVNSYTITFDSNGGSAVAAITQPFGSAVSAPTAPTKTGYTFGGWYSDAGLNTAYTFTTMPAADITLYAKWTANSYTITFNSNGGSAVAAITQPFGSAVSAPTAPTKAGYTFGGWYSDAGLNTAYTFTTMPASNITLYAKWTALPNHTVTFDSNSGTGTMTPQVANVPTALTLNTFTRTGYTFAGWNTLANGTGTTYADGMIYSFAADITLYAKWTANSYTITFNSNGGSVVAAITQPFGSAVSAPTAPTKTGNTFGGWYSDAGLNTAYTFTTMPASNITLYAKWTANSYTITFNSNGGSVVAAITQPFGSVVSAPTAPTKTGNTFGGWYSDAGLNTAYTFTTMPAANITLYAKWTVNSYTITFNSNGGSTVAAITQPFGSAVSAPTAPTKTGNTFGGWYSDAGLNTAYTFTTMPAADITLYAKWTANSYTITFNSNGGSVVAAITQPFGSAVSAPTAPTKTGNTFGGWYSDAGLNTAYTFTTMPASNITLYAKWTVNSYTITFDSNGGSVVAAITQPFGSAVSAPTAPTKTGYTFGGWYSDAGLNTAYTFTTMPAADITLYAKWTANSYTITFNSNGGSAVAAITQPFGSAVSAPTAPTKAGYTFGGWYSDAGLNTAYTFTTMPASNITLYAKWTALPNHTVTFDSNSGTGTMTPQVANVPTALTLNTFTRTGYTFVGWNTLANGTGANYTDGAIYSFAADITLYAKWTNLPTHTVTFNANGGTGTMTPQVANVPTALTLNTFTRTGYTFAGWNTLANGTGANYADGAIYSFAADITLYAKWTVNSYTITFNSNGGSVVAAITQPFGSAVSAPTAPTKTGNTFGGWYSDAGLNTAYTFTTMPASNITLYAKWTANSYTITFNSNGGSAVAAITQPFGSAVSAPTAPTKTGNTFGGWYSDAGLTTAYTFTTMPASNITLYAKWTANSYTITFNSNGGSVVAAITQPFGSAVSAPTAPTKTGNTFGGWYSDAGLTTAYTFTTMPAADITLYAKWTANSYTITFNSNGGSAVAAITQPFGSAVSAPTAPTKTGYTFGGWYSDAGLNTAYTFTTMPASNITLYAKWTVNSYTITFNSNGGSAVAAITQPFGSAVSAPTAPTKTGNTFGGWYSDAGLNTAYTFTTMPAADITLYAKWTANSYTITFNSNGGSAVAAITQPFGSAVSAPTAPTKTGYTFGGWYSDAGLNTAYTFTTMPAANITLYAKWTALPNHTVTFDSNSGTGTMTPQVANVPTALTLNTFTRTGYTFVGWNTLANGTGANYTDGVIYSFAADITLYAKWTNLPTHTVTFNANGGTGTMTPQVANVPTALTLNTFTRTGYTFAGWNTLANGTGANYTDGAIYSFAADITLYAKWTVNSYTITFNSNGGSAVAAITQPFGSAVSAPTAPTKTGNTFGGWYSDAGLNTAYTFTTMPASNITLYAKWTANSYTITFNSNGGSAVAAITQLFGSAVSAPTAPTKAGNTFGGWYSDAGLNTAYTFTTMPAANITLYAKWTALPNHTVTFNSNSGTGTMTPQVANVPTALTLNTFTRTGYTFAGWNTLANGTGANYTDGAIYSFAADITLYAKWTNLPPTCYALTLSHTGQGTDPVATPANSTGCATGQYLTAASISLSGAVPTSGWQISTWTGTNNDTSTANINTITMPAQAHSASVNYTLIKGTPTLSVTNSPVIFNGTPQAATVTGSVAGTVSNIKYNGSATVPTNAGTYTVTANFVPNDTAAYNSLTNAAAGSFSINKATPTLSVMNSPVVFNATPQAAIVTGSVTGVVSNIKYNGSASVPTAIGTYAITADFVAGDSANYNSLINAAAGDFVINNGSGGLGSGGDTTGVFRPSNGLLYLKNANTTGFADIAINYGLGGDYPITGDWDGNGTDTIGIYRNGSFYLRNSNTIGFADLEFAFGLPGDQPVSGDWDGDGTDTIGVYRNGQFLLRNSNSAGPADTSFYLGNPGDVGIAGDWDGDGLDTTGVFRPSNGVIFLKNTNESGFADIALNYGLANDQPVIGDWNDDGIDTIGVYRNGSFYLRNSNTIGFADIVFALGIPGDMPISGNWDGIP